MLKTTRRKPSFARPDVSRLRVAVIGYGSIGRRHAENLRQLGVGRITLVRRRETPNPAFSPPENVVVVSELQAALDQGLDLAIVCTPTRQHVEAAVACIYSGTPVLIEKPVAANFAEAQRLASAAEEHSTFCSVAYCMRYHPAYSQARDVIRQGRLGVILEAKAWFESWLPDWHPWEDYRQSYAARIDLGGGVLPTLDHEIDFLRWCLGKPRRAKGSSHRSGSLEIDVDDTATLAIEYPGNVMASCALSFCRRDRQRGFEFIGSEASLRYSLETGQLLLCGKTGEEVLWEDRHYDSNQMYVDLLTDCVSAMITGQRPPAPLDAGITALEICQQVRSRTPDA